MTVLSNKNLWGSEKDRQYHYDERIRHEKKANYGYLKVPEDEKTQWVLRHFNSVAGQYDFMNTLLSFGIHYLWKRTAIGKLRLGPGDRVLDVCGGTGDLAILAKRAVGASGEVTVYDINRAMIDAGRFKKTNAGLRKQIHYVQGNAEHIAFPAEHFDAVMVGFGIRNVTHMEQGFGEMLRVLKPGGRMMCPGIFQTVQPAVLPVVRFLFLYCHAAGGAVAGRHPPGLHPLARINPHVSLAGRVEKHS
jgi:demethylmenaquinone methyltransferase / 2-methoxy-6-polyprenyl-1,4-benzoquinol methylase